MFKNKDLVEFYNHKFDFSNQHKTNYDDWIKAFKNAVKKRATKDCFIGMSSGYDSGALVNEINKNKLDFKVFSVYNNESKEVIDERLKKVKNFEIAEMDKKTWDKYYNFLSGKIDAVSLADTASMGVAQMFEAAKKEKRKVCICGQGGDEIISDYSLYPGQSTFKGVFPENLYEWDNFREGMNRIYLNEIEGIAEIYGIECRYPFLDVDVVQEFLWLSRELKNNNYKAPLFEYLTKNKVPFEQNVKRGFNPIDKEVVGR
jgi:asparagine synthetase B (glutamine-hydrolysing)